MAAAASGTLNISSEYAILSADSPPISFCTATSASHMDWLNAMSVLALGITIAMRNCWAATGPTRAVASRPIANATISKPRVFILFPPRLVLVTVHVHSQVAESEPLNYSTIYYLTFLRSLVFASFKGPVQRHRFAFVAMGHGQHS